MKLRALQARELLAAEDEWAIAKKALEEATRKREKQRARCRPGLVAGKSKLVGGIIITVTPTSTGRSFSLAKYLERHKITKAMQPFVGDPSEYDRWTVKRMVPARTAR